MRPLALLWDGGTCRHILIGLSILVGHHIPTTNSVSALFSQWPFLPHSLFGDVVYGLAYQAGHLNGLVLVSSAIFALSLTWSYQIARNRGLGFITAWLLLALGILVSSLHWSARCQEFSYLAFLSLYIVTFLAPIGHRQRLSFSAVIMFFWVNFHGTFALGLIMLAVAVVSDWLSAGFDLRDTYQQSKALPLPTVKDTASAGSAGWKLLTLLTAALTVCLNVRGPAIYSYVGIYLTHPLILFKTDEFRSIDFLLGLPVWLYLGFYILVVALWLISDRKPNPWEFILLTIFFCAGLHTMRLMPYFVLIALPAAGPPWQRLHQSFLSARLNGNCFLKALSSLAELERRVGRQETMLLASPATTVAKIAVTLVLATVFLIAPQFKITDFDPHRLPVRAVSFIANSGLKQIGFNLDNWGGYLYYRLRQPVFLDDWTPAYPTAFLQEYVAIMQAQPGWQQAMDRYKLEYVLIPPSITLGAALINSPGWRRVYHDEISEVYRRAVSTSH